VPGGGSRVGECRSRSDAKRPGGGGCDWDNRGARKSAACCTGWHIDEAGQIYGALSWWGRRGRAGRGLPRPQPGAGERLDPVRLDSATRRYTAFLCCDLAALSPAAAARLYVSSVLPLKVSNRRRQSETPSRTALTVMAGSHDLADTKCRRTVQLSLACTTADSAGEPPRSSGRCTRQ